MPEHRFGGMSLFPKSWFLMIEGEEYNLGDPRILNAVKIATGAPQGLHMASTRKESASHSLSWLVNRGHAILLVSVVLFIALVFVLGVRAATYQPPPNLNTYPPPAVPSWLDTGSNAWMLTAATLVGLMSLPGLAVFYGGLAKKRFVVNTLHSVLRVRLCAAGVVAFRIQFRVRARGFEDWQLRHSWNTHSSPGGCFHGFSSRNRSRTSRV